MFVQTTIFGILTSSFGSAWGKCGATTTSERELGRLKVLVPQLHNMRHFVASMRVQTSGYQKRLFVQTQAHEFRKVPRFLYAASHTVILSLCNIACR